MAARFYDLDGQIPNMGGPFTGGGYPRPAFVMGGTGVRPRLNGNGDQSWLDSGIEWVQGASQSGANNIGEISDSLLNVGYTLAQISAVLDGVANSPITTDQQYQAMMQERAYLQQQQAAQGKTALMIGLLVLGVILVTKDS